MTNERAAFGGMLEQLVDLGAIEFRPEPLDAIVERRLKAIWTTRTCPSCDADALHALDGSARIWCGRCDWKTTYTRGTPFYDSELAPGEFLVAFVLYADSLLSINQIAPLLDRAYKTVFEAISDVETAFARGFPTVWERIEHTIAGPTQVDETQRVCSGFKGQNPPRDGLSRGGSPGPGRARWTGEQGDEMTLVAACRDVLQVISAEEGSKYDENLGPVIKEAGDLSQPLGEIWTDELPAYQQMEHEHRTVVHDDEYVSEEGIHTNQVECLWSLVQPWLAKFRGLSKQGLEQAARTFGLLRSLNLVQAPIHSLVDCVAVNVFR
ncbi:IS1595 family transposase [Halococcus sediminicola]|uniref:IS1595 family transposase n=1 Tax=Halococcus sediminicola TaxID=1264579 RepID=UPI000678B73A|nr:IS1595 family transposase [Halococcus sediminicola]